jgi:hypothetical protein
MILIGHPIGELMLLLIIISSSRLSRVALIFLRLCSCRIPRKIRELRRKKKRRRSLSLERAK